MTALNHDGRAGAAMAAACAPFACSVLRRGAPLVCAAGAVVVTGAFFGTVAPFAGTAGAPGFGDPADVGFAAPTGAVVVRVAVAGRGVLFEIGREGVPDFGAAEAPFAGRFRVLIMKSAYHIARRHCATYGLLAVPSGRDISRQSGKPADKTRSADHEGHLRSLVLYHP